MRIVIFGASGGTGRHMVLQALSRNHEVIAVVRRPDALAVTDDRLTVCQGDVLNADCIGRAIKGSDAVVSALGVGNQRTSTTLYSEGVSNLVAALPTAGTSRLVAISAAPAGPWSETGKFERLVIYPLLQSFFGAMLDDMRRMEKILTDSEIDWTIFRPPRLTDHEARGTYRTSTSGPLPHARTIARSDLAAAVLDAVTDNSLVQCIVAIAD